MIPRPDHVVIIIEENKGYSTVIGSPQAPNINYLAQHGALMTQSFAVGHPSQPNYLALFSGSTQGVTNDVVPHTFTTENLASELIAAGLTFGGYSENMPSVGFTGGAAAGGYARKHNPWVNFTNVPPACNMPFSNFPTDASKLATVSIVVPNLQDDMHDGTVQKADTWLKTHLDAYRVWADTHNSLLIVTFDEGTAAEKNRIPTIFYGPMVKVGQYAEPMNHYNVLRTIEDMYSLPHAALAASLAGPIDDIWN